MMSWPYPFWFAHRGAGKLAPENTLAAFRLGASHGFHAFECDVKLSADGVPFLLHDATLERTTSGAGPADALPWAALASLDAGSWHGEAFAGEPIPSFEAIAKFCIASGYALNVEIKPVPGRETETGRVVAASAARWWANESVPPLLSSFQPAALAAARVAAPHLPRALLLDTMRPRWIEEALALGCDAIVVNHRLLGGPQILAIHRAGLRALCYTVNDERESERLRVSNIDGLITDAVDRLGIRH
jgi:glycerophosphoryl diester phosphodiesterase